MKRFFFASALFACLATTLPAQSTIFLVRHAEKMAAGDLKDPDLSEAGRARAKALAVVLKDAGVTAIYATEFKRTQQTAEPLARALGLKTVVISAEETETVSAKLKEAEGNALIVAHSNTIPEISKALGAAFSLEIGEADYDNLFVLVRGSPVQTLRLHYR